MAPTVRRTACDRSSYEGRRTLVQRFVFEGRGVDAEAVTEVLLTAPLVGEASIFGRRPGREEAGTATVRHLSGFSPVPGFRFDVDLVRRDDCFVVHFSQPDRPAPYLHGDLLWTIEGTSGGATLDEQINTDRALEVVGEPLGGSPRSLRRWLFFRIGHEQVMKGACENIATLIGEGDG